MIRSGVIIRSVQRASWDEHAAAMLSAAGDACNMSAFDLLAVNHDSYALVRNMRGCIYVGAYAGRGAVEFVLHILRCGFACIFSTRHVRAAMKMFRGLYTEVLNDVLQPGRCWFFLPVTR